MVATTTKDSHTDRFYANGRMQVPVIAYLGAIDKKTSEPYSLLDSDLDKIELYDLDHPSDTLSGSWSYTDVRNPLFASSLEIPADKASDPPKETSPARAQVLSAVNPTLRTKTYWVSATTVEVKHIAARVRQPDDTVVTTKYSVFNSFVKLTGAEPIIYTMDSVNVAREDTGNGNYNFYKQESEDGNWFTSGQPFDQDNYYVTSKFHPFVKADIYGLDCGMSDWRMENCYSYHAPDGKNMKLSLIWGLGVETVRTVGLFVKSTVTDASGVRGLAADAFVNMRINKRSNAVCLTRLAFDCTDSIWGDNWSNDHCGFTVYDVYGNAGKFAAGFSSNHNLVAISNAD